MTNTATPPAKPLPLRVIFILNAVMVVLPLVFYGVVTSRQIDLGGLDPRLMLFTAAGYALSFAALVLGILKRHIATVRTVLILNAVIALPAKAYIGMAVAAVSMALTFNAAVRRYFSAGRD